MLLKQLKLAPWQAPDKYLANKFDNFRSCFYTSKKNMVLISSDMLLISLSGSGRRTIKYGNEHNSVLCSWSFAMTNISQDNTRKSLLMSADSEEDVKQPSKDHYTQTTAIPWDHSLLDHIFDVVREMQKAKLAISSSLTACSTKASNRFKSYSLTNDDECRAHPLDTTVYGAAGFGDRFPTQLKRTHHWRTLGAK